MNTNIEELIQQIKSRFKIGEKFNRNDILTNAKIWGKTLDNNLKKSMIKGILHHQDGDYYIDIRGKKVLYFSRIN